MRKWKLVLCIVCLFLGVWSCQVLAEETQLETYMEELDLQSIQESVEEMLPQDQIDIREMILELCRGKLPVTGDTLERLAQSTILSEIKKQRTTIVQILVLAMTASVFSTFLNAFTESKVQEIGFYMVYLLLFALLLKNFRELTETSEKTMDHILQFMRLLLPVYLLAASLAAAQMTAMGFYEMTLFVITVVQSLIRYLFMPGMTCYVLLAMLGNVTKEAYLSRMTELLRQLLGWMLKTLLALVIGIQTIQRILYPALDQLKNSVWIKAGSALPVVGNTLSSVTETLLGTASVLKNAVGVGGMLLLVYICIRPVLRLGLCYLLYRLLSALIQPVADARFVRCVDHMADAVALLFMAVAITGVMFFLTVAIVTTGGA